MLLIVANVLPTMGIVSLIPVLPQLFGHFKDAAHAQFLVPAIITAPSICIALLAPVAGTIADKIEIPFFIEKPHTNNQLLLQPPNDIIINILSL